MSKQQQKVLFVAVRKLMRPLVRILLRNGVAFGALADAIRKCYVDVAFEDFAPEGKKQTVSRVSALTGLTRKEVKRLHELDGEDYVASQERYNRAVRVISGWMNDRRFSDVPGGVIEDGQFVEVKGTLVITTAINATRIELEDEGIEDSADTVSLEGFVSDFVNTGNFRVSGQRVNAAAAGFSPAGLADINVGDFLEIEGYIDGGGNIVASQLQRDEPGRIELRGPVDVPPAAGDDLSGSVSILGITIRTDESTDFEDQFDSDISGSLFFIQVSDDDLVEYHDEQADGIAEEVEFQD